MPNWCDNTLYITGPAADAAALRALMTTPKSKFDFRAILPMPDGLRDSEAGSKSHDAWELKYGDWSKVIGRYGPAHFASREAAMLAAREADEWRPMVIGTRQNPCPIIPPRSFDELADAVHERVLKYGHRDWYSWRCEHWGTKWPASDAGWMGPKRAAKRDAEQVAFFTTAWSPPVPVVAALSRLFPAVVLRLAYHEAGGDFAGFVAFLAGDEIASKYEEIDSRANSITWSHCVRSLEEEGAVYVGLGRDAGQDGPGAACSKWANPFASVDRSREEASRLYRQWVVGDATAAAMLPPGEWSPPDAMDFQELIGKTLVCDCGGAAADGRDCHAATLCDLAFNRDSEPEDCSEDERDEEASPCCDAGPAT